MMFPLLTPATGRREAAPPRRRPAAKGTACGPRAWPTHLGKDYHRVASNRRRHHLRRHGVRGRGGGVAYWSCVRRGRGGFRETAGGGGQAAARERRGGWGGERAGRPGRPRPASASPPRIVSGGRRRGGGRGGSVLLGRTGLWLRGLGGADWHPPPLPSDRLPPPHNARAGSSPSRPQRQRVRPPHTGRRGPQIVGRWGPR